MVEQSSRERLKRGLNLVVALATAWLLMGCSGATHVHRYTYMAIELGETQSLKLGEYRERRLTLLEVSPDLKSARLRVEKLRALPKRSWELEAEGVEVERTSPTLLVKEYWVNLDEPIPFTGYAELAKIEPEKVFIIRPY